MTTPVIPTLGASTLARKWLVEVDTGAAGVAAWTAIGGITNCQFQPDSGNWVDDSDYSSGGGGSETKTAGMASATLTIARKVQSDDETAYDVGQEFLRAAAINKYGPNNSVSMRFSEYDPDGGPRIEAYSGLFGVDWVPQGGDDKALDSVQVTLHGQGKCAAVAHPYPAGS